MSRYFLTAAAFFAAVLPAQAQDKVLSDHILPQDTYMYVSFPSVAELKSQLESSSFGKIWADPAMDDFKAELEGAFEGDLDQGLAQLQAVLGMSVEQFLAIPSGEVSLAISGGPGNALGVTLFLDYGDSEDQVTVLLDKLGQMLSVAPDLIAEEESFDGTDITMFRVDFDGGRPPTPLAKEFGWFVKDQRLVIASRQELLEGALSNWNGEDKSLMDNENYAYILGKCQSGSGKALTKFYFDPYGLFNGLIETQSLPQEYLLGAAGALGFLQTVGVNQFKGMGGVSEGGNDVFESVSRSLVLIDQPPQGLMRIFQLGKIEQAPPSWVKENAHAYMAVNWKVGEAYDAIAGTVNMIMGANAFERQVDGLAQQGPGVHIKEDVIDVLNGDFRIVMAPGEGGGYGTDQILLVLGVKDDEAAQDLLTKVTAQAPVETREFKGATIYEGPGPQPGQSVSLTVAQGRLMIAIGGGILEQVLRDDDDVRPLSETAEFKAIAEHFPADTVSVQFTKPAEQYRSIYEALRTGDVAEQFPGSEDLLDRVDFTTLPEFDVIAKHIKPVGGYAVQDENGYFSEAFQLK
jgi:hypothetical protein